MRVNPLFMHDMVQVKLKWHHIKSVSSHAYDRAHEILCPACGQKKLVTNDMWKSEYQMECWMCGFRGIAKKIGYLPLKEAKKHDIPYDTHYIVADSCYPVMINPDLPWSSETKDQVLADFTKPNLREQILA